MVGEKKLTIIPVTLLESTVTVDGKQLVSEM